MNNDNIFRGTIMCCAKYTKVNKIVSTDSLGGKDAYGNRIITDEVFDKDAILLKTENGFFVDIKRVNPLLIPYLYLESKKKALPRSPFMSMSENGSYQGELFVLDGSLRPYATDMRDIGHSSLSKIRKENRKK